MLPASEVRADEMMDTEPQSSCGHIVRARLGAGVISHAQCKEALCIPSMGMAFPKTVERVGMSVCVTGQPRAFLHFWARIQAAIVAILRTEITSFPVHREARQRSITQCQSEMEKGEGTNWGQAQMKAALSGTGGSELEAG
ncbi:hypothetical protein P7K49_009204, partial [Saguinus oedipus]